MVRWPAFVAAPVGIFAPAAHAAVYLSPQQAKALYKILEQNVVNYEQAFGEIKLDARNTTPPRPLN